MSFKKFLQEQPHFVGDNEGKCPKGHSMPLGDARYMYDYGFEFIPDSPLKRKIQMNIQWRKGKIPSFCRRHNLFFIYDFDKHENSAPKTKEEKEMINMARLGILTNAQKKNDKRVQTEIKRSTVLK